MTAVRLTRVTLFVLGGLTLLPALSFGQEPKKDESAVDEVNKWVSKDNKNIPAEELPKVKAKFLAFAKWYADLVATPSVYKASIDPKFGPGVIKSKTLDRDPSTGIFLDFDRYILEPNLTTKVPADKADYIREMGIAFDAVLKPLILSHQERIVRINATRMLVEVCRSGATALWPTVTELLANPATATEIKHYALQAAANLLAAYDVTEYKTRKHSNGPKEVGNLVKAVTTCVLKNEVLLPGFKAAEATPENLAVISFVRRQAIRALAQVRFVTLPGPDNQALYPAFTLAQVCVSDPVLLPAPSPAESVEAVLGLCNMAPTLNSNPVKDYNADAVVEAIAAGLRNFAAARTDSSDRSLPWRQYSIRLAAAFKAWPPLFDPDFDPTRPERFNPSLVPMSVTDVIGRVQIMILVPIDKVDFQGKPDPNSRVDIEGLERFLESLRGNTARKPLLFTSNPNTALVIPEKK